MIRRPSARAGLEAAVLLALSVLIGLAAGALRRPPLPLRLPDAFFRVESGARPLVLEGARRAIEQGGIVVIDTRDERSFREGRLPGALLLPAARWEERLPEASPWLQGAPLLLYGAARDVNGADLVAAGLLREGYGPITIFVEGFEAWHAAGLPVESGAAGPGTTPFDDGQAPDPDAFDDDLVPAATEAPGGGAQDQEP